MRLRAPDDTDRTASDEKQTQLVALDDAEKGRDWQE